MFKKVKYSYVVKDSTRNLPLQEGKLYFRIKNFSRDKIIKFVAKVWRNGKWIDGPFEIKAICQSKGDPDYCNRCMGELCVI